MEAVVEAEVNGQPVSIDFLNHVLGTKPAEIKKHAVEIMVPVRSMGDGAELPVPFMHPLHLL